MNSLIKLSSSEVSYAIGWTIIHSLWQSCLIALAVGISYAFTQKSSANTRYWISILALAGCVAVSASPSFFIFMKNLLSTQSRLTYLTIRYPF